MYEWMNECGHVGLSSRYLKWQRIRKPLILRTFPSTSSNSWSTISSTCSSSTLWSWWTAWYVCMYVCIYVCMYKCMYICMYIYVYICMYVCIYAYMYVCMYVCMHVCMHVCINASTYYTSDRCSALFMNMCVLIRWLSCLARTLPFLWRVWITCRYALTIWQTGKSMQNYIVFFFWNLLKQ